MFKNILKKLNFPDSYVSVILGFLIVVVGGLLLNNYFKTRQTQMKSQEETQKVVEMEEKKPELPATHEVAENETLWTISEIYYGSGYNWVTIAKENNLANADYIQKGQKLNIPKAEVIKPQESQISAVSVEPEKYTVQKGDFLWQIAVNKYGDGYQWVKIAKANNLVNPNLIFSGNILIIPR